MGGPKFQALNMLEVAAGSVHGGNQCHSLVALEEQSKANMVPITFSFVDVPWCFGQLGPLLKLIPRHD